MKNSLPKYLIMVILSACMSSCYNDKASELYPAASCSADSISTVSFRADIIPLLMTNCAVQGCHSGTSPEANLDLDSASAYTQLAKAGTGYIDTLNPTAGLLYASLVSTTEPMPPTGKLDECRIRLVLKWLQLKAPDN